MPALILDIENDKNVCKPLLQLWIPSCILLNNSVLLIPHTWIFHPQRCTVVVFNCSVHQVSLFHFLPFPGDFSTISYALSSLLILRSKVQWWWCKNILSILSLESGVICIPRIMQITSVASKLFLLLHEMLPVPESRRTVSVSNYAVFWVYWGWGMGENLSKEGRPCTWRRK